MATKSRFLLFILMVILPAAIAWVSVDSFFIITSILMILLCGKSLRQLCILNFGSDEAFAELERQSYQNQAPDEMSRKANKTLVLLLNILFIIFFVYISFISDNIILRFAAGFACANWIYDMLRNISPKTNTEISNNESWTIKDTLAEFFLWFHNILTIAVVGFAFAVKFL